MITDKINCPKGHGEMSLRKLDKCTNFRGIELTYQAEVFVCPVCNMEAGTVEQASGLQKTLSDAYRRKKGLLTGDEIRRYRKRDKLTRQELATLTGTNRSEIREWEEGLIQPESADHALRTCFSRKISIPESLYHNSLMAQTESKFITNSLSDAENVS